MFKLDITHTQKENFYNEVPQHNPMRWQIMFRNKDTLSSQAHLMKCRDFFNDLVAKYVANVNFRVYSFDNKDIKFNKFGLYFLLSNIHDVDQYIGNVERTLIPKLKEQLGCTLRVYKQGDKEVVVRIPPSVFTKTFYISAVTLALRMCNYNQEYQTWEDLFAENNPANATDHAINTSHRKYLRENGFNLPDVVKQYWFFCGKEWNSDKTKPEEVPTVIHNNGVRNWIDYMKQTGAI